MINKYFIAGLVEGEGYFGVNISKNDALVVGYQVLMSFGIDMDIRELELLKKIKDVLGCGKVHIRKNNKVQYRVRAIGDIVNKIIPFFNEHELQGGKKKDFVIFKTIASLMEERKHVTMEGFDEIKTIRKNMHIYGVKEV